MPHIHTNPGNHDLTASAFIVRTDGDELRVLLHMHKKLKRWMHMGGHVELHENPWAAVIHEIKEESGYELGQLRLLQPINVFIDLENPLAIHPLPFVFATYPYGEEDHFHTDVSFVFTTTEQQPKHEIGEGESTTLQLFTKEEIISLPDNELYPDMRARILYIFDTLLHEWKEVDPGIYPTRLPNTN